ncbi:MAG TPA: J domain-containing protein [Ramlibacter sp.]
MTRTLRHTHYDTLQVERGASGERVRAAYRRLAQKFHPDKHPGRSAAAAVMAELNQAYEVLSDPDQRSAYDEWLASQEAPAVRAPRFTPDRIGWGAWLVFATTSLAVLTVGYVVLATWAPATPAPQAPAMKRAAAPSASELGGAYAVPAVHQPLPVRPAAGSH